MIKNNKVLLRILLRIQWQGKYTSNTCPICNSIEAKGHTQECVLNKYLTLSRKCSAMDHHWFRLVDKEEFLNLLYDIEQRVLQPTEAEYCVFCGRICDRIGGRIIHAKKCILKQLIDETESRYIGNTNNRS